MKKIIIFSIFTIIFVLVVLLNTYYINTKNRSANFLFSSLNEIYFDLQLIENASLKESIEKFIKSGNTNSFIAVIKNSNDPIGQFYAFCGLLNTNPQSAIEYMDKLITSFQKVNIVVDRNIKYQNSELGFAILLLVSRQPEKLLSIRLKNDFYKQISQTLLSGYSSKLTKIDKNYKRELVYLIGQKVPALLTEISKDITTTKPLSELTEAEKIELSYLLPAITKSEKEKIIQYFLNNENNEQILINIVSSINENDSLSNVDLLLNLYKRSFSDELKKIILDRFFLLTVKNKDINRLLSFMRHSSTNVILFGLNKIKEIGDDSFYDFLKLFLDTIYEENVNIEALKTIFLLCYKTRSQDVLRTINYVLINIDRTNLAMEAIKILLENNISANSSTVLYRLKKENQANKDLKLLALNYIDTFNVTTSVQYLKELEIDSDAEVREKARSLLNGKFKGIVSE